MDKKNLPIGVFDSGLGGISVLRELVALMPEENYIFYGDSKNAPYGTRTLEEVQTLTCQGAEFLVKQGVKALVIACNTATSAAISILRKTYTDIPVIGIEPALKPAVLYKDHPRVLVMATPMTLREEKFHQLMQRYQSKAEIIPLPCPGLVEYVEEGKLEGEEIDGFLKKLFAPYQKTPLDCVVLGCTHYPLIRATIEKALGNQVQIFDGGEGTAKETYRRLEELHRLSDSRNQGTVSIENSLLDETMISRSYALLHVGKIIS